MAAAVFNRLSAYPDDGRVAFDYGYGIRAVVAIAPVDGTYRAAGQELTLRDTSYLVLHGSHDMDVFTFQGAGQYKRARISPESTAFKASLYVYGANHGQFNTSWGRKDLIEPVMRGFNLRQLMPPEDQREVAQVAISAFLDAALRDVSAYRGFLQDPRRGAAWLPATVILSEYADGQTVTIADFEEDADLMTATLTGATQRGEGLAIWREQRLPRKRQTVADQVVVLGWSTTAGNPAVYAVRLNDAPLRISPEGVLVFSMAQIQEDATPDVDDDAVEAGSAVDLTVALVDLYGEVAKLPLAILSFCVRSWRLNWARPGSCRCFRALSRSWTTLSCGWTTLPLRTGLLILYASLRSALSLTGPKRVWWLLMTSA